MNVLMYSPSNASIRCSSSVVPNVTTAKLWVSPLVKIATVVRTEVDGRAILYDAGLITTNPDWPSLAWRDTHGALQHTKVDSHRAVQPMNVGGRTRMVQSSLGS